MHDAVSGLMRVTLSVAIQCINYSASSYKQQQTTGKFSSRTHLIDYA